MDQVNVQRWASSLRQSPRNLLLQNFDYCPAPELHYEFFPPAFRASTIATDGCGSRDNGVRNVSASMRIRENKLTNDNRKYSLTLNFSSLKKNSDRDFKPRFYTFDMTAKSEEKIHSPSPAVQHDLDAVSDTGTYTIDDDVDHVQEVKPKLNPRSSILKRYVNETMHSVNRPVVDTNIPTRDLPASSSNSSSMSSIHSLSDELNLHSPLINQIKPAECFVVSPGFETKPLAASESTQRRGEASWRAKFPIRSMSTKDSSSARPEQNLIEQPSFSAKTSTRPHTARQDPTPPSSTALQSIHANPAYHRLASAPSTTHSKGIDEPISKATNNKSPLLRQQRSAIASPLTKPAQPQAPSKVTPRPLLKQNVSTSSALTSNSQTNRAVELRRARAQAKIEELDQRTKKQLPKPETSTKNDIMSVSWHSSAVTQSKTNPTTSRSNLRSTTRPSILPERENLSATRTISSVSPNPPEEKLSVVQRKSTGGSQTNGLQSQRMTTSAYSIGTERCDTLRENGQRLAIRLIQLSSGILQKLKLSDSTIDDNTSVDELTQLVEKLQSVNETLTTIDAALTGPMNDDAFI